MTRVPPSFSDNHAWAQAARPSATRSLLTGAGLMAGACLLAVGLWHLRQTPARDLPPETGPVVLAMQKIGQLHTASFTMKDVVRQQTQSEPEGVVSNVPGVEGLVHWATRNQALVVASGTVEAGIDLAQIAPKDVVAVQGADGKTHLRVHLPPVAIYAPNVTVRVEENKSGLLWRDENIVPKAQERAAQQFRVAAEQSGLRRHAQDNAIQTLRAMQHTLGYDMDFYF